MTKQEAAEIVKKVEAKLAEVASKSIAGSPIKAIDFALEVMLDLARGKVVDEKYHPHKEAMGEAYQIGFLAVAAEIIKKTQHMRPDESETP